MNIKQKIKNTLCRIICVCNGVDQGRGAYIGLNCKIVNKGKMIIGDNVSIRPQTHVYLSVDSVIEIGEGSDIGRGSTISSCHKVRIGKGVLTGPHVYIADHNHKYSNPDINIVSQGVEIKDGDEVSIGDGSWLGTNVVVAGNVRIGCHCVIGANSVVTKDIPDYCVAVGAPARIIKRYNRSNGLWETI